MSLVYLSNLDVVAVGTFGKSVGLKGGIRVFLLTDFCEIIKPHATFYIEHNAKLYDIIKANTGAKGRSLQGLESAIKNTEYSQLMPDTTNPHDNTLSPFINISIESYTPARSLAVLQEITNREHANLLRNMTFYSTIEETKRCCKLAKDEFFYFDIIGMSVIDDGVPIGEVKDILQIGSTYYFMLSENLLIPYIDRYVMSIDIHNKIITTKDAISLKI